jgi:excisionase family DNA binding protein
MVARMRRRSPNPRRVKTHFNYTVEQAAKLLGVHKNTMRRWIVEGLPVVADGRRPTLILGQELASFLDARRKKAKRTCPPGFIYCVKCRIPQAPAGDMAEYMPMSASSGNLRGICPSCETLIHRRVNFGKLDQIRGQLEISMPQGEVHIGESGTPSVSSDFDKET